MNCKCKEDGHGHYGLCDAPVSFRDSIPMDYYKDKPIYGKNGVGAKSKIGVETIDCDKNRCCNDCYDKIKNNVEEFFKKTEIRKLNPL